MDFRQTRVDFIQMETPLEAHCRPASYKVDVRVDVKSSGYDLAFNMEVQGKESTACSHWFPAKFVSSL
jgi:hypothetical protein